MTCREKLKIEYPEYVKSIYIGGCKSCPDRYGYIRYCERCRDGVPSEEKCARCWDREISGDFGWMIKKVIFNNPATIVLWSDGTKTVVKCQEGDVYDPEKGLAMAISKKALGNKGNFNEVFKKWLPKETALEKALANLRQTVKKCMSSLTLPSIDIEFRMNKEKENVESEKM